MCLYKEPMPPYTGNETRARRGKYKKVELTLLIRESILLNMLNT